MKRIAPLSFAGISFAGLAVAGLGLATAAAAQPRPGEVASTEVLTGAQIYENVCQACHMANAKGAVGAGRIASLARNPDLAYPEYPIAVVTGGKGAMPWFRGHLTDQQIADVISYVRVNFGNRYPARVTVAQVAANGVPKPNEGEH